MEEGRMIRLLVRIAILIPLILAGMEFCVSFCFTAQDKHLAELVLSGDLPIDEVIGSWMAIKLYIGAITLPTIVWLMSRK
jgi:hypothetical protein